jgi:hypothetical protein
MISSKNTRSGIKYMMHHVIDHVVPDHALCQTRFLRIRQGMKQSGVIGVSSQFEKEGVAGRPTSDHPHPAKREKRRLFELLKRIGGADQTGSGDKWEQAREY